MDMITRMQNLTMYARSASRRTWAAQAVAALRPPPAVASALASSGLRLTSKQKRERTAWHDRIETWRREQALARVLRKARGRIDADDVPSWMLDSHLRGACQSVWTQDRLDRRPMHAQWSQWGRAMLRDRRPLFDARNELQLGFICLGDEVRSYRWGRGAVYGNLDWLKRLAKCEGETQAQAHVRYLEVG